VIGGERGVEWGGGGFAPDPVRKRPKESGPIRKPEDTKKN